MNTRILNLFVVLMLVATISCNKATFNKLNHLKQLQGKNQVGQHIVEIAQLQLATGGEVDTIVRLLQQLDADLQRQQVESNQDHQVQNDNWNRLQEQETATINDLEGQESNLHSAIDASHARISSKQRDVEINTVQIKLTNYNLGLLKDARAADVAATTARVAKQQEVVKALNYILGELNAMVHAGSFLQLSAIKKTLQKLVKENPVQALVQLTMTFEPESVNFAIHKLQEVRDAVVASLNDEAVQEAQALAHFEALSQELEAFLSKSHTELDSNNALLAEYQNTLAQQEDDLKKVEGLLHDHRELLASYHAAQDAYNLRYEQLKAQRSHEQEVISQVVNILSQAGAQVNSAESNKNTAAQL